MPAKPRVKRSVYYEFYLGVPLHVKTRVKRSAAQDTNKPSKKRRQNQPSMSSDITSSSSSAMSTGMTSSHQETFVDFAKSNDLVVIVRPINPEAAQRFGSNQNYTGKRLNTKGKSSEFGPIAGDIPYQATLSKLAKDNPSQISAYQKKNDEVLAVDEITYRGAVQDADNINKLNDLFLVSAISKKDNQGREIYFLKNEEGDVLRDGGTAMPVFIVAHEGYWLRYSNKEKTFNIVYQIPEGFEPDKVKIMAYRYFEIKGGQIQQKYHPITADYDELASASIKRFPFELNEQIQTQFTREVFTSFLGLLGGEVSSTAAQEKIIQGLAKLIYRYEEQERREHRDRNFLPQMGVVNAWELAGKVYLKHETAGATNHGPETNNPWPEPMSPGNYVAYLPDEKVIILRDEQEVCNFINEKRKEGFPLDVNPKWGWDIDLNGNLFIPEYRLNWDRVREQLEELKMRLLSAKDTQIELLARFGLKYSIHNIELITAHRHDPEKLEYLENHDGGKGELDADIRAKISENKKIIDRLTEQYELEGELVNLKMAMEKLRLEPDIVYNSSSHFSPQINNMMSNDLIREAIMKIGYDVSERNRQQRKSMFELYFLTFRGKKEEFIKKFRENSILMSETFRVQKQSELSKLHVSNTASSERSMGFNRSY